MAQRVHGRARGWTGQYRWPAHSYRIVSITPTIGPAGLASRVVARSRRSGLRGVAHHSLAALGRAGVCGVVRGGGIARVAGASPVCTCRGAAAAQRRADRRRGRLCTGIRHARRRVVLFDACSARPRMGVARQPAARGAAERSRRGGLRRAARLCRCVIRLAGARTECLQRGDRARIRAARRVLMVRAAAYSQWRRQRARQPRREPAAFASLAARPL